MSNSPLLKVLQDQLHAAREHTKSELEARSKGTIIHVPGIGKTLSAAYEQLRNAAEYTEEHLLLQHAAKRFYSRNFSLLVHQNIPDNFGEELIIELTQASYFKNDTYSTDTAKRITVLAKYYYAAYWQLRDNRISREVATRWMMDMVSVQTEEILNPHSYLTALAYFQHQHYLQLLPRDKFVRNERENSQYELCLYIAVHDALLKSDTALVRADLNRLYRQTPDDLPAFIEFNRLVTQLYSAPLTQKLQRAVSRYGAPMRVLNNLVAERSDIPELLNDKTRFIDAYNYHLNKAYRELAKRLDAGLMKSIIFIFITKVIIGLGIEVPYDLVVHHSVALIPLFTNLLFPPLYMASLKLSLKQPSNMNANALRTYMEHVLFTNESAISGPIRAVPKRRGALAQAAYTLIFFLPLAIAAVVLHFLEFNIVQGVIFFVFLSTASFLGFRLSRMVRELELVAHDANLVTATSDFFYLPFIVIGRWVSSKYAKVNVIARLLDLGIEMPLKSTLKMVRQWIKFLRERQEEIY